MLTDLSQAIVQAIHDLRAVFLVEHMRSKNPNNVMSAKRIGEIAITLCEKNNAKPPSKKLKQQARRGRSEAACSGDCKSSVNESMKAQGDH